MKKRIFLFAFILYPGFVGATFAQDVMSSSKTAADIKECIASNPGADSVDCLKRLYYQSNLEIRRMENRIVAQSRRRWQDNTITGVHYRLAASSMRDAARRFRKFSERQCDFEAGYSGAVASGYGQVRFSCLLNLNEGRKAYLRNVLNKTSNASQQGNERALRTGP